MKYSATRQQTSSGPSVPLERTVAVVAALLMVLALASVGVALHEHDTDAQHADCEVCHVRHLSAVDTDGAFPLSELEPAAHAVASTHPDGELDMVLGSHPARGPPAWPLSHSL